VRSLDEARAFIANARWIFARTMPENPHWYTLRKENANEGFESFVVFIRQNGYRSAFKGHWYVKFDIDGWTYWTMGAPLSETILINRSETNV
jgi:hypothetical protein